MAYAILFNGPPGSGKDFLSAAIGKELDDYGVPHHHLELKQALQAACMAFLGYPNQPAIYASQKDVPQAVLRRDFHPGHDESGLYALDTLRAFMIAMSEEFLKRRYSPAIHANLLFARNAFLDRLVPTFVTVSDLGFSEEVQVFIDRLGAENVLIVKLYRDGHDFSNDSRNYVRSFGANVLVYDNTDKSAEDFLDALRERMRLLGWIPMKLNR